MSIIDGIGGAFLFSNDPKRLAEWYRDNLGITYDEAPDCKSFYKSFETLDVNNTSVKRTTTWAILATEPDIRGKPRTGQINYRVTNMADALATLRARGVSVDKTEDYPYGKFAWLVDPDGNKIELFEEAT